MSMDDHTDSNHAPEDHSEPEANTEVHVHAEEAPAPKRSRWRRPHGRWSNPASPLQAARFAARMSGNDATAAIRRLCVGHAGRACKFERSKLSDFEHRRRTPGVEHIVAFCKLYQRSPEELGLILWRDEAEQEHLRQAWLRDSAIAVATVALQMLAACPVRIPPELHAHTADGDESPSDQGDPPVGDAPA